VVFIGIQCHLSCAGNADLLFDSQGAACKKIGRAYGCGPQLKDVKVPLRFAQGHWFL
jgi:hypothetical protein